jgi:hypothetical protein
MIAYKYTILIEDGQGQKQQIEYISKHILNENWECVYRYHCKKHGAFVIICWDYDIIEIFPTKRKRKNDTQLSMF